MITSPCLVVYAEVLLLIQYVYGLDLNDDELPMKGASGELDYEELGFKKWRYPCVHLAIQVKCVERCGSSFCHQCLQNRCTLVTKFFA